MNRVINYLQLQTRFPDEEVSAHRVGVMSGIHYYTVFEVRTYNSKYSLVYTVYSD